MDGLSRKVRVVGSHAPEWRYLAFNSRLKSAVRTTRLLMAADRGDLLTRLAARAWQGSISALVFRRNTADAGFSTSTHT
ncbi:MAG: hypothetical protein ACK5L9_15640 [Paracoccus sp. (in: a-proteobacteria)]